VSTPAQVGDPHASAPRPKAPGGPALVLSILGFCYVTAIVGVIWGFRARKQARDQGLSQTKSIAAIIIGLMWVVPVTIGVVVSSNQGRTVDPVESSTPSSGRTVEPLTNLEKRSLYDNSPNQQALLTLRKRQFECTPPSGAVELVQCRKGTVEVQPYGKQPKELVNLELAEVRTGSINGYVLPRTARLLEEFGVQNLGDDGSGTGVVAISN
jgi:hypothetical protein